MYEIIYTRRFKKAYKRVSQFQGFDEGLFRLVLSALASGKQLPQKYKDHQLKGKLKTFRECHITPDILLVYELDRGILTLTLVSIGNHSQLFK